MDASWPIIAGPAVAVVGGAFFIATAPGVLDHLLGTHFDPRCSLLLTQPRSRPAIQCPSALAAVSVAVPMLGRSVLSGSGDVGRFRPVATAILSVLWASSSISRPGS